MWESAARSYALAAIISPPGNADAAHAQHQLAVIAVAAGGMRAAVDCIVVTRLARAVAGARAHGDAAAAVDALASARVRAADVDALPDLGSAFGSVGVARIATARVEERRADEGGGAGVTSTGGDSLRGRTTLIVAASSANVVNARRAALANVSVMLPPDTLLRISKFTQRLIAVEESPSGAALNGAGGESILTVATALLGLTLARWALICSDCVVGDGVRARALLIAAARDTRRLLRAKSISSYFVYRVVVALLCARACAHNENAREAAHSILIAITTLASSHTREVIVEFREANKTAASTAVAHSSADAGHFASCSWLAASVEVSTRAFAGGTGPPLDLKDGRSRAMLQSLEMFSALPRRFAESVVGAPPLVGDSTLPSVALLEDFDTQGLLSILPPNNTPNQPTPSIAEEDAAADALSGLDLSAAAGLSASEEMPPAELFHSRGVDYIPVFAAALAERSRRVSLSLVAMRSRAEAAAPPVRQLWHRVKRKRARAEQ